MRQEQKYPLETDFKVADLLEKFLSDRILVPEYTIPLALACVAMDGHFTPFNQLFLSLRNNVSGFCHTLSLMWTHFGLSAIHELADRLQEYDIGISGRYRTFMRQLVPSAAFSLSVPMQVDALLDYVENNKDSLLFPNEFDCKPSSCYTFKRQNHAIALTHRDGQWGFFDCNIGSFFVNTKNKMKYILLTYGVSLEKKLGHTWYFLSKCPEKSEIENTDKRAGLCYIRLPMKYHIMESPIEISITDRTVCKEINRSLETKKDKQTFYTIRRSLLLAYAVGNEHIAVMYKKKLWTRFVGKVRSVWGSKLVHIK